MSVVAVAAEPASSFAERPLAEAKTAGDAPEGRLAYLERVHHEHENILEAIRRQEPEAARALIITALRGALTGAGHRASSTVADATQAAAAESRRSRDP